MLAAPMRRELGIVHYAYVSGERVCDSELGSSFERSDSGDREHRDLKEV